MEKIALWGNEFISRAFSMAFNPPEPSNSRFYWLSNFLSSFQNEKKLKIDGVIKNLRGADL